jgi:predicted RNase H-like HicB family nuclease
MVTEEKISFTVECEKEEDGRWLAEVLELPGVLVYGQSPDEAMSRAEALGLRALADRLEHGEVPFPIDISFAFA